jgi:hypothetical protein
LTTCSRRSSTDPAGSANDSESGATLKLGAGIAMPVTCTVATGVSGSLVARVSVASSAPGASGTQRTPRFRTSKRATSNVVASGTSAGSLAVIALTCSTSEPGLLILRARLGRAPTSTVSKRSVAGLSTRSGAPITLNANGSSRAGDAGSLLSTRNVPE